VIIGAHAIIYSRKPEADRSFLKEVLRLPHVDAGDGWLIFGLPPSELAVHPATRNGRHEFFFLCSDVDAFVREMRAKGVSCGPVRTLGWGRLTQLRLPGGGKVGVYEPRHRRPRGTRSRAARTRRG